MRQVCQRRKQGRDNIYKKIGPTHAQLVQITRRRGYRNVSSPPTLVWTSWSPTSSPPEGTSARRVIFQPGPSFQIRNARRDAGGLDAVSARREIIFSEMDLGLDDAELIAEVAKSVVLSSIVFDLCCSVPIVEVGDGTLECVVCRSGTIEKCVEPDWYRLGNILG
jgi:hypothetical protein